MSNYARVSVNIAQLTGLFDYHIPANYQEIVQPGSLVNIPFGKQTVQGIVVRLLDEPSVAETRPIEAVVDRDPVLTPYQLKLGEWLVEENLSTLSQCLDMMLPQGLSQHADVVVEKLPATLPTDLTSLQLRMMSLLEKRGDLRGRQLDAALPRINWRDSLPGLIKRGLVISRPVLPPPTVRPRYIRTAQFSAEPGWRESQMMKPGRSSAAHQRRAAILEFLETQAIPVNVSWVYAETGGNAADLNKLSEMGLVILGETEIWRDPLGQLKPVLTHRPVLTEEQSAAWSKIRSQVRGEEPVKPNLVIGVTGSGKTELYLLATEEVINSGRGVIILVPEISLTPQTVKRFFARFPGKVGLIHSKLSPGERYDTWRRIRSGCLPIVIGPRSALFSPLPDPGLIVVDECHDPSYHQEDFQPHYHTLETALAYSRITRAQVLFGSATPELEMIHLFKQKNWNMLPLPKRVISVNNDSPDSRGETAPAYAALPEVQVVDMRDELAAGNRSALSRLLQAGLQDVLARDEQAILFLNRRGSASYVFCRDCGLVLRCPRCDTQLTFHANEAALVCHTCNYRRQMPGRCPDCHGTNIRQFGMGTESLEKLIQEQFASARVLRWDSDTVRYKGAHDLILDHFIQHRADILIGTQMLAKGLDLPLVTLVGVVLADISLNLPDFRAAERTYQLLTQVAGRAGRSERGGRVVFQSFQPQHYAIASAATYDSTGFYDIEMGYREKTGYPPFSRMLKVEFRHSDNHEAEAAALATGQFLQNRIESMELKRTSLIGPVPCFYQRRSGLYRWQILVRGPDPRMILQDQLPGTWVPRGVTVDIIVDPSTVL